MTLIAKELNEAFPEEKFTQFDIDNFFKKRKELYGQVLRGSQEIRKEQARKYINTLNQLSELNEKMWGMFYEMQKAERLYEIKCSKCGNKIRYTDKDFANIIKAAEHLLKQLKTNAELLGELKKASYSVTYNINELSLKLLQVVRNFEKKGYIKVLNKRAIKRMENEM